MSTNPKTPVSPFERELIAVVSTATFVPGTGPKRFIRDLCAGRIENLTERGRWYLAFVAHRFRRQYHLRPEQWAWINEKLGKQGVPIQAELSLFLPGEKK